MKLLEWFKSKKQLAWEIDVLRENNRELKDWLQAKQEALEQMEARWKDVSRRFDNISGKFELGDSSRVEWITAEAQLWGEYFTMAEMDDDVVAEAKVKLAGKIANGLLNRNILQFIVKMPCEDLDPLNKFGTVAAKLAVIPWDRMAVGKRVELRAKRRPEA